MPSRGFAFVPVLVAIGILIAGAVSFFVSREYLREVPLSSDAGRSLPSLSPPPPIEKPKPPSPPPPPSTGVARRSQIFGVPCVSNPNLRFDQMFTPLDAIAGIIPPGAAASGENKPHSYVDLAQDSIPLYAPADMDLAEGAFYREPPTFSVPTTYLLHFSVTCELILNWDHVTDPVEKIKAAFPNIPQEDTRTARIAPIHFKKGELIGYTKGGGTRGIRRFDFGFYDTTKTNHYVNQDRYTRSFAWKQLHAVCPYDYFVSNLKNAYYGKFVNFNGVRVPGAPCRSPNQDKAGTLSGSWFFSEQSSSVEQHLALAMDIDGQNFVIASERFGHVEIASSNPTFKDPNEVTSEHCYFEPFSGNRVFYFRLLSPLKAELWTETTSAGCPSSFPPTGTIFLYR